MIRDGGLKVQATIWIGFQRKIKTDAQKIAFDL